MHFWLRSKVVQIMLKQNWTWKRCTAKIAAQYMLSFGSYGWVELTGHFWLVKSLVKSLVKRGTIGLCEKCVSDICRIHKYWLQFNWLSTVDIPNRTHHRDGIYICSAFYCLYLYSILKEKPLVCSDLWSQEAKQETKHRLQEKRGPLLA